MDQARRDPRPRPAVAVRDLDRAGAAPVGRAGDRLGAVGREPVGRDGRRRRPASSSRMSAASTPVEPRRRLERARRAPRPCRSSPRSRRGTGCAGPPPRRARPRPASSCAELVHPLLEGLDDRADPLVGLPPRPPRTSVTSSTTSEHDAAAEGRDDDDAEIRRPPQRGVWTVVAVWIRPRLPKLWAEIVPGRNSARTAWFDGHLSASGYHAAGRLAGASPPSPAVFLR